MNKKLILSLILPLTIIIFILFTKWWIVDVIDGRDGVMYGFPFIYRSPAFYTSCAEQYFITELILDFIIYFGIIFVLINSINRFNLEIKIIKIVSIFLYFIASILIIFSIWLVSWPDNLFIVKRDFDI